MKRISACTDLEYRGTHFAGHDSTVYNAQRKQMLKEIHILEQKCVSLEKLLQKQSVQHANLDRERWEKNMAKQLYWKLYSAADDEEFAQLVEQIAELMQPAPAQETIIRMCLDSMLKVEKGSPGSIENVQCFHIQQSGDHSACDCLISDGKYQLSPKAKARQVAGQLVVNNLIFETQSFAVGLLNHGESTTCNFFNGFIRKRDVVAWNEHFCSLTAELFANCKIK